MAEALPLPAHTGTLDTCEFHTGGFAIYQQHPLLLPEVDHTHGLIQHSDLTLVCTAEFYNRATLAQHLHTPASARADEAAIIGALYRQYGIECVRYLSGAFAFALWDAKQQQLLLATDAFGIQPLYYYFDADKLVFGSRLNAILKVPAVPKQIDLKAVFQYLYFSCVPTPYTIYQGIKKLPPGHYLLYSKTGLRLTQYWDMHYEEEPQHRQAYFASTLRQYLAEAVRVQATYGGQTENLGSFLSGGTDSSTVSGLLGQVLHKPAKTFSIGFAEERFNEIAYARIAARHFGTEHYEYFVTPEDTAALIPKLVHAYDEPFGNASAIPTYYCAKLAREHGVEILLAGDGGDELFGGNTRYVTDKIFEIYHYWPLWLRQQWFEPLLFHMPWPDRGIINKARKYVRRANIPQPQRFFSYNLFSAIDLHEIFTTDFLSSLSADMPLSLAADYYTAAPAASMLNRLLHIDLKIAITDNDLRKVTRMCELANVRVRYPMLDRALVEFSGKIPAHLKVRGFRKRYIFKEAFKQFLPPEILAKKKHGFGLPISPWLRDTPRLQALARDTLLSQTAIQRGYFQRRFLEQLFELHRNDQTPFFGDNLWIFLMLELWHQARV
jgi:asparagine synthase (glutamine-hydrolysing)